MNWLHNISMAYKILCLSIVAAIGMAAIAYTGYHYLAKTESSMKCAGIAVKGKFSFKKR